MTPLQSTFAYSMFDSIAYCDTFRYAQEEIEIHDKIVNLVPGFQETIIKFQTVPNELIAFINLVCSPLYAPQRYI
jgi:hypothetical protein